MRNMLVLAAVLPVMGCSAMLRETSPTPSANYASLSIRAADGAPLGEGDGIWYIDGHDFQAPQAHVFVARGRRVVGYQCPGWVSVDNYPGLQHEFVGGKRYEMVCEEKGPVIFDRYADIADAATPEAGYAQAQGGTPQIKCEVGTPAWCIATFDGSISMQDAGESRIWALQARTFPTDAPMKIIEAKACSQVAGDIVPLITAETGDTRSGSSIAEYALDANGCTLRFEIPGGASATTYRQVMLFGVLVGPEKRMQLYKAEQPKPAQSGGESVIHRHE